MYIMEILTVFADNMKKYRKQAKLTQERLAELCDTDHRYIGQIETGRRCPSLEYVERIAVALNIAPYHLFCNEADVEKEGFKVLQIEQKQRIKAMIIENAANLCLKIDEQ